MRYKRFGKTGMNVSVITVGTWAIGGAGWGEVDRQDSIKAILAMLDEGVNFIDTAPCYGMGYSEEVVGEAIRGLDRSKFYLATKAGFDWEPGGRMYQDVSCKSILRQIDGSLQRLGTDYVDLYLIHKPDFKGTLDDDTMEGMLRVKESGKCLHIGISNYPVEGATNCMKNCMKYGDIEACQPPFSMVDRTQLDVLEFSKANDMGVMSYGSLGAGVLTGAIRSIPNWDPRDVRFGFYPFFKEPKFSRCMKLVSAMDTIAQARNVPVAQVAVNWSTQNPLVDTALMGVRNPREAKENCDGTLWELTADEIALLNAAIVEYEAE